VHLFGETLDQLGTFSRTVADAARLASALADAGRIAARRQSGEAALRLSRRPWTDVDCDADDTLDAAATTLRQHGAEVVAIGFPAPWREAHLVHRTIMLFEAGTHLATLQDRERTRLSPKLNAALDEGRAITRADYAAAMAQRDAAIASFTDWFADYDAVIAPPRPARRRRACSTGDPSCCTVVAHRLPGACAPHRSRRQRARSGCSSQRPQAPTIGCSPSQRGADAATGKGSAGKRAKKHRPLQPRAAQPGFALAAIGKGGAHGKTTAAQRRAANVALAKQVRDPDELE
jgi:hypothetical protein